MDPGATTRGATAPRLTILGLGPGDLDRLPRLHEALLIDPDVTVVVRTLAHPAAARLAALRPIESCDDLYETAGTFDEVYSAIVERVETATAHGPTIYAVPGSPLVGEFAVHMLLKRFPDAEMIPSESFVDLVLRRVGYDPFSHGLRILNGHELPDPLVLDCPTIVGHLDTPLVMADVVASLGRVLPGSAELTVLANLGADDEVVMTVAVDQVPADLAGFRTSLWVDTEPAGLFGVVGISRRLRRECPWDREQTHDSLVTHLVEEVYELIDALAKLPSGDVDYAAYDAVEEELGDVLAQVLFHADIAAERGAFSIDDVATRLGEKLVRRHPHVFGDVKVSGAGEVATNWERIKRSEKGDRNASLLDGVPEGIPALARAEALQRRAAEVGFDWDHAGPVVDALLREVAEVREAMESNGDIADEIGDVLFTVVNLMRRLDLDPEVTLRRATDKFERRFRAMEQTGPLEGESMTALDRRWQAAKDDVG